MILTGSSDIDSTIDSLRGILSQGLTKVEYDSIVSTGSLEELDLRSLVPSSGGNGVIAYYGKKDSKPRALVFQSQSRGATWIWLIPGHDSYAGADERSSSEANKYIDHVGLKSLASMILAVGIALHS